MEKLERKPFHESVIYGLRQELESWGSTSSTYVREKNYDACVTLCTLIIITIIPKDHLNDFLGELNAPKEEMRKYSDHSIYNVLSDTLEILNKE